MKWSEIRKRYPDKFILIGDLVEEKVSRTKFKVVEGKVLKVSDEIKEIREAYQHYKRQGKDVLFSLPSTPQEFIVENVPTIGIMK